jgi:hypothetical protein
MLYQISPSQAVLSLSKGALTILNSFPINIVVLFLVSYVNQVGGLLLLGFPE